MSTPPETDADAQTHRRQQAVLAEFRQRALEGDDVDELLEEALVVVVETLETTCGRILEVGPDGEVAVPIQLVDTDGKDDSDGRDVVVDGEDGDTNSVPLPPDSPAGDAIRSEQPVVVDDGRLEAEPVADEWLAERGVASGVAVSIGSDERTWGVLETYVTTDRTFTRRETQFVRAIGTTIAALAENQQSRLDLEEMYGRISDAFFALDEEWNFTYLNDRAHELINPENRELVGENIWDEFPAAVEQQFKPQYERAMDEQEAVSFEEYYPTPLDSWFNVRVYPSETGLSVYFRDVSDRKERERRYELFRILLDYSNDSVLVIEPETGQFLDVNETACRRLGYDRDELLEMIVPEMEQRFDDLEEWQSHVEDVKAEGAVTAEGTHERSDGSTYPAEVNVAHVELDREYMIGVARDITERRQRKHELEESNERLEQFAYAASHDLQEPLRMITSYLQLLEEQYDEALDEDGEEFLEFAVDGAERMREMIDGLLEYSRVDTQGEPFEPVDLNDALEQVRDNLQVKIDEHDADISSESLPRVRGDERQLQQLLQNLLANALEYSGDEPPRVHVEADRTGPRWTISVRDEGIGIDTDDTDRIFDVFERLHSREDHDGAGIGLSLCQRIVERHDGDIWVETEPGDGATFSFTLPPARDDS